MKKDGDNARRTRKFQIPFGAAALLLVAAIVTVTSFASLVNAGDSSNAASANPANVSGQINDLPESQSDNDSSK